MKYLHPKKYLRIAKEKLHDWFWYYMLPDSIYLKIRYKQVFGKKLNLKNPQTFNEKIQWLKLHDRRPEYHNMVDKYEVKDLIAKIIGEEYVIKTLGVWDKYDDVDFDSLPEQFVLKCTHDSASITICTDKSNFDKSKHKWKYDDVFMNRDYYHYENKQWVYKGIKPRIIAEELLQDDKYDSLADYKFNCFNGKVKCVYVMVNRFTNFKMCVCDANYSLLPFVNNHKTSECRIECPENFELMKKLAEKIARFIDNPYVRVDFYEVKGKVYFGEITFNPDGGMGYFDPEEWNYTLGSWMDLTKGVK